MFSIRKRLLASVIVVLLFSTFCEGLATYFAVQQQVDRLLDNSLKQVALSLNSIHSGEIPFLKKGALLPADDSLVVQIHDPISGITFISRGYSHRRPTLEALYLSKLYRSDCGSGSASRSEKRGRH